MSYDYDGLVSEIVVSRKLAREAKAALAAFAMKTKEDLTRDKTKIELDCPDAIIVKHFFSPHLVIQAKVTNNSFPVEGRSIGNLA